MDVVRYGGGKTQLTGPISDGKCVRQSFTAVGKRLTSISVLFSTYQRQNPGAFYADIVDPFGNVVATDMVESPNLRDNKFHTFKFDCKLHIGRQYELKFRTLHCRCGMSPTMHFGRLDHGGYLFVGARLVRAGELVCEFRYEEAASKRDIQEAVVRERGVRESANPNVVRKFLEDENKLVSIIILNKDGFELINRCVRSIIENVGCEYEVIIGDTGSLDKRVLELYENLPPNFRVVRDLKYHYGKLNNELARQATGGYLLFLNNDVSFECDVVSTMLKYGLCFIAGAIGLRLMKTNGTIDHDGQLLWNENGVVVPDHVHVNRTPKAVEKDDCITQGVTAACMLTRKDLFDNLGGFDTDYEDVYQDCDYCLKLAEQGFKCLTVRTRSALHVGSATRGPTTPQRASVKQDRAKYMSKWKERFKGPSTPLFSMITCANDADVYGGMMKTLEGSNGLVEWVAIRNHENVFTVTQALNTGKVLAQGKYLCYCHQDIRFCNNWLTQFQNALEVVPDDAGIIGFEGLKRGGTPYTCRSVSPARPQEVDTLDELCLITEHRDLEFDEGFFFHYYGADICMQSIERGFRNFLVGVVVKHLSGGCQNILKDQEGFKAEAQRFREKWSQDVWTTTTKFLNGGIYYMILEDVLNEKK